VLHKPAQLPLGSCDITDDGDNQPRANGESAPFLVLEPHAAEGVRMLLSPTGHGLHVLVKVGLQLPLIWPVVHKARVAPRRLVRAVCQQSRA
jgi:hypothetical protein